MTRKRIGHDITFLVPNRRNGSKTPDIEMSGLVWEIKSPKGKVLERLRITCGLLCSNRHIVLDLRRMDGRIPTRKLLSEIERRFNDVRAIRRIIVITRQGGGC